MTQRERPPTQIDVARIAGVSQAAVSYVLNGKQTVALSNPTKQRILDAIEELGYAPNRAAQTLKSKRTFTVAAIIPDITNPYFPAFMRGVQDVALAEGYDLISYNSDGDREVELKGIAAAVRSQVDGLIMTPFHMTIDDVQPLCSRGIPLVLTDSLAGLEIDASTPIDIASVDNQDAAHAVAEYLIGKGHTRIGMIAGQLATPPREERVLGYRRAITEHRVPVHEVLIQDGEFTEESGYASMRELLRLDPCPTAVMAANDLMAIGAIRACYDAQVRVPEDVAIAGFDNIAASLLVRPALTTLDQFANGSGRRAAELLFDRLTGRYHGGVRRVVLPHELVIRDSA